MQVKKILVPTDFSPGSGTGLAYAQDLARKYGARLVVLHVIYDIERDLNWYASQLKMDDIYEEMETASRAEFDRMGREELAGFDAVDFVLLRGVPHEEVLRYAKDNAVDLIVVGTHGRAGLDRMFFGSTASKVVRHAPCPVLTVRIPERT